MDDSDIDDEEQLRQAIALSLQDQNSSSCVEQEFEKAKELPLQNQTIASIPFVPKNGTSLQEAIDLESDDDGESAQEVQHGLAAAEKGTAEAPNLSTFLGLNRKAMEQERLERRQRKRKASISPPSTQKIIKFSNDVVAEKNIESSKLSQESQLPNVSKTKYPINLNKFSGSAPSNTGPVYLNGTVKKTWALRHPRLEDIKLEEVLQRDDLTLAVLSSFQWDVEWLLKKINTKSTQMTFVMQAEDESVQRQYEQETATMPNLRFCFPSMEGQINCMHSKLMLLSHPTHLRIVIPTGNLMPYDWGETGVMENMVFIIDLPRLPEARSTPAENMTSFGRELVYFLEAMELEDSIVQSLHNFDFSQTEDLAFVHSIGGAHHGEDEPWRRTGFCGLGKAIQELGLKNDTPLLMDMVTSSLGALNLDFLMMLYLAAQGDDGLTGYKLLNSKPGKAKASKNDHLQSKNHQEQIHQQITENFRIYFPTHDSVASSTGGTSCGGTICFQQKWYNAPSFPKTLLRDCKSQRRGLLMHNKLIFGRPKTPTTLFPTAWTYLGSANCSESAWGKLTTDRHSKMPKLTCRNWECGVVIPVRRSPPLAPSPPYPPPQQQTATTLQKKASSERGVIVPAGSSGGVLSVEGERGNGKLSEAFEGRVPVPMVEVERYEEKRPWFFLEG